MSNISTKQFYWPSTILILQTQKILVTQTFGQFWFAKVQLERVIPWQLQDILVKALETVGSRHLAKYPIGSLTKTS